MGRDPGPARYAFTLCGGLASVGVHDAGAAPPPQTVSSVEPDRELVVQRHRDGVAGTAILQRFYERGYTGTLASLSRVLHRLEPHRPSATVRVEREPGSAAQVDVGSAGRRRDPVTGTLRKTWAFVMILA
jgi:hypothetical protein